MALSYETRGFQQPIYADSKDQDLKTMMQDIYNQHNVYTQSFLTEAHIDERFYAGDSQLAHELYPDLPYAQRKGFKFDKTKRIVNMVSGYQRQHRKSLVTLPIEGSDQKTSDQLTKVLSWANNRINMSHAISEAFLGSLICGLNLLHVYIDRSEDPFSGDINVENYGYSGFMIDPFFTKLDLSDCNYIWTRKFFSLPQILSLFPEKEEELKELQVRSFKDQYFKFMPENYAMNTKGLFAYDEFYYKDFRDATLLIDEENEQQMEYKGKKDNLKYIQAINPKLKIKKAKVPTVKLGIVINNQVFHHDINPMKIDKYPFVPFVGYHQPEIPSYGARFQGIVRGIRDAQFVSDRRTRLLLEFLESQINSGKAVMEHSLVDDKDAFKAGNGQVFYIKKDAPLGQDSIRQLQPPSLPAGFMEVIQMMDKSMMETSGVNEELLGSAEDDKAGVLSMLRQGAGLTTLQVLFDRLDLSMKVLGNLEIDLIQANFSPHKIGRIINEEPTQEFFNNDFDKYDCVVTEGINTPNQQMMAFKQGIYLKELGIPVSTKFLLEMSQLQNKSELIEDVMQEEQQQAQQAQIRQQLEMQELQARAKLADARADADYGLKHERNSRTYSNYSLAVERELSGIKDLEQAQLDKIKTIKELQEIDLGQIQRSLEILKSMQDNIITEKEKAKIEVSKTPLPTEEFKESLDSLKSVPTDIQQEE